MTTAAMLDAADTTDDRRIERSIAGAVVPDDLGGRAGSLGRMVEEFRPLFALDPSRAVELVLAPVAASAPVWECGEPEVREELALALLSGARLAGRVADDQQLALGRADGGWVASGRSPLMAATARADVWSIPCRDPDGATGVLICSADALGGEPETIETVGLNGTRFATIELTGRRIGPRDVVRVHDAAAAARVAARTRVLAMALGAAATETALRMALPYAAGRELYRGSVLDIPHARGLLAEARTDLLVADALVRDAIAALDGGRADAEAAVGGAATLVPRLLNESMRSLSVLFGSTFYARVEPYELFETRVRDIGSLSLLGLAGRASPLDLVRATDHAAGVCRAIAHEDEVAAADDAWLDAALQRLEARISRRRAVLTEGSIDAAVADLGECLASGLSTTFDRRPISLSPTTTTPEDSSP